ncbi:MAG TPA: sodium:proton antiporter [Thermoleophilia bacterium]|nr:sodium:proton antiporter [Thermoleophilia bacterium]
MVLAPHVASTAGTEQALVFLLIVAAAVAVIARRVGVPYVIGLVLVGLFIGLTVHWTTLRLSADLVFYVFLPILLFEAGYNLEAALLRDQWRPIAVLAFPGVLVAFGLTAAGVHWLGGLAWGVALLFGALIAATDPVSVVALFRKLGVSERLTTLVDAESLFNDGAAAVLFAVVAAVVVDGRDFSAGWAVGSFLWMSLGGTVVGLAVGFGASWVHRRIDDHIIEITLSTIVAYGSFLLAQQLHMSGVVACVTAAIVLGNLGRRRTMSAVTRVTLTTVWDYAAFVANSLIFLLIGLSVRLDMILSRVGTVLIAFVVVLVARAVTVYGFGLISRAFGAGPPLSWQHVLVWGGLRGTIALALVLSVPLTLAGRADLVTVTFGVVLLSLLVQGLTIPWLTRRLGLAGDAGKASEREREALLDGFVRAHEELDKLEDAGVVGHVRRRDLEAVLDGGESSVLEGLPPLDDEPAAGDGDRIVERIGELVAQRRSLDALRHGGAVTESAAAPLAAEVDERIAVLAARLGTGSAQE